MDEHRPLDLSALGPGDDPEAWQRFVDATLLRVDGIVAARSRDPLSLIASWSRQLTVVALLLVGLLIPVEYLLERRETGMEQVQRLVRLSAETALEARVPSGAELVAALDSGTLP